MIRNEAEARAYVARVAGDEAAQRLDRFADLLREENERQNLVAKSSLDQVWLRHFADSVQLIPLAGHAPDGVWLDLGSGAGFPGVVLALCRSDQAIRLVESRQRRVAWLNHVVSDFGLSHCEVIGKRLEQIECFAASLITARAFAPLDKLLQSAARFSSPTTVWLLPKGRSAQSELQALSSPTSRMFHVEQSLTSADAGILVGQGRPVLRGT